MQSQRSTVFQTGSQFQQTESFLPKFKVFSGLESDHMTEVLHTGLSNDEIPECFPVKNENKDGIVGRFNLHRATKVDTIPRFFLATL